MNNRDKTINFIKGKSVPTIPFHPLVMQFAAKQSNIKYGDYCQKNEKQVESMLYCANNLFLESVHPSGFAYCEAEAYGAKVIYPEDGLPYCEEHLIKSKEDFGLVKILDIKNCKGMMNRVEAIKKYSNEAEELVFIRGHMEGPFAEYSDLRGLSEACFDFYDNPKEMMDVMRVIVDNAKAWAKLQVEAGAHCMSIGDAACSQIGDALYRDFIWDFHKELVEYIHGLGAYVQFHICGDITNLLDMLIETKANIIDIDHMVKYEDYIHKLGEEQVFSGNIDPIKILRNGAPKDVKESVFKLINNSKGKCIISSGCEVIIDTPIENYLAMKEAIDEYGALEK